MDSDIGGAICIECEEAGYLCNAMDVSFEEWNMTLYAENFLWKNTKKFVDGMIRKIDKSQDITKQANDLADMLTEQISTHLQIYNKDELIVALLIIKEAVRRTELKEYAELNAWSMVNEYELALKLIEITLKKPENYFLGAPIGYIEDGYSNFITAISLGRIYVLLISNIEMIKYFRMGNLDIREIAFRAIETEETEKYYQEYIETGLSEKPEDYKIENEILKKKLDEEGKSKYQIERYVNQIISDKFGFTLDDLKVFSSLAREEFKTEEDFSAFVHSEEIFIGAIPHLAIYDRRMLKDQVFKSFNQSAFDNIINTFSINKVRSNSDFDNVRMLELRSIYEKDDLIIFGRIDFMQNVSTFEKFAFSGHYIEYFMPELQNNNVVQQAQKKLSTYLSYVVADKLFSKNFILPMSKTSKKLGGHLVPRAEIDKIVINGVNILREVGDIDVLALNKTKDQIILFEFKHYKPAIGNKDLIGKDKSKIENEEIIRKIKARDEVIKSNVKEISEYFDWNSSVSYSIRSILITSRPNFYAINSISDIEYYTWAKLMEMIEEGTL